MEPIGAFPEGEWEFNRILSMEELDFTPEFPLHCLFPLEHIEGTKFANPQPFFSYPEANASMAEINGSSFYSGILNDNLQFLSQDNSSNVNYSDSVFVSSSSHETYSLSNSNSIPMSIDISVMDDKTNSSLAPLSPEIGMTETVSINEGISSRQMRSSANDSNHLAVNAVPNKELELKRKFDSQESRPSDFMKKKPRITRDAQNGKSKRNQKPSPVNDDEEESNAGGNGQSSYSCNSDEDSHDSIEGTTLGSNGKKRASRGSATDPQSLYARRRRERINERLKILQNLVPNGTKVDISTMLEEAVHYVKFLQLQIKLLSSDDLWMYAPIAYNGVDVGLNQKISVLLERQKL
ncbi:hypothetical protein K2173_028459 [Erythroxylum novogranatense]|uniref:BHLH domain-containing protein n=1 Tax=Erythroxylum novogranatense TaxID=1862640 RepID=A0AAV8U1V9_9ROSI|nr:hypothetical protein K2173_028459 [Erythroxylum novogranatense]